MKDYQSTALASSPLLLPAVSPSNDGNMGIIEEYYPGLGPTVRACLAVCGAMSLKGRTRPLSLILEGGSGSGKTAVLQMFMPRANPSLNEHIYRSDRFTPKSFVSHAANVSREKLAEVDMLPRLKDKVLVTKELATLFRGKEDELRENFSMLISVLDGEGFVSDSGVKGRRGYEEGILFNWLGATTPLPANTHRMMSQLGTRLLFWEVPAIEPTEEELLKYAERGDSDEAAVRCNEAINNLLCDFYNQHPVGSVDPESIIFPQCLLKELVRWAMFIVKGRAEIKYEKNYAEWEPVAVKPPEGPWKVINYLKDFARGHALINGRTEINEDDLAMVAHVALSSIPGHLRPIIRQLQHVDAITSTECKVLCAVSRPTSRKLLRELEMLGLVKRTPGSPESNEPDVAELAEAYHWLKRP